jgi:hypothetical protein
MLLCIIDSKFVFCVLKIEIKALALWILKKFLYQGCQMVSFQTKNPNLGKFWRAQDWKMLLYFMAIWDILQTFVIF